MKVWGVDFQSTDLWWPAAFLRMLFKAHSGGVNLWLWPENDFSFVNPAFKTRNTFIRMILSLKGENSINSKTLLFVLWKTLMPDKINYVAVTCFELKCLSFRYTNKMCLMYVISHCQKWRTSLVEYLRAPCWGLLYRYSLILNDCRGRICRFGQYFFN